MYDKTLNHVPKGCRDVPTASADYSHEAHIYTLLILYYEYYSDGMRYTREGEESVSTVVIACLIYDVLYRLKL